MSDTGVVQVDLERLDRLLNLVGELVTTQTRFVEQGQRARARYGFKEQVLNLVENTERVGRLSDEIQSRIIKARLVPVESMFHRFTPLVKELSKTTNKEIQLQIEGGKTEVDKRTIDALAEPLVHLIRNSLDHGIESADERERAGKPRCGSITLEARHEGNRLVVQVRDDGAGVDLAVVRNKAVARGIISAEAAKQLDEKATLELLFHVGFSTNTELTTISGRGLGMDAARQRVQLLGGRLELSSVRQRGTTVRIDLPITTAIVEALMVGVANEVYALPIEQVYEIVHAERSQVSTVEGISVLDIRGEALFLVDLADLVQVPRSKAQESKILAVVLRYEDGAIALAVDKTLQRHQIVIKGLGQRLAGTRGIAGATIGGDGNVVMVLDVGNWVQQAMAQTKRPSQRTVT